MITNDDVEIRRYDATSFDSSKIVNVVSELLEIVPIVCGCHFPKYRKL